MKAEEVINIPRARSASYSKRSGVTNELSTNSVRSQLVRLRNKELSVEM